VPRVLIVGSANVDFTVALPRLPRPGETVSEGTLLVARGGKGANQAVAARRLGADVRLIACVGDDASGREVRGALAAEGIGVDGVVTTAAAATGTALIVVDVAGHNQIAVAPGANRALAPAAVDARAEDFTWAEVVVVSLEVPLGTARRALEHARRHGGVTILNPAPLPDRGVDFLALADYVTPNETEAARLSGLPVQDLAGASEAAAAIRALGAARVIVTLGAAGALAVGPDGRTHAPAPRVTAVDTTGAGDAFNGGFLYALLRGRPARECLRIGNFVGARSTLAPGGIGALPRRRDLR